MTIRYKQPTFDVGVISPQVLGRTDLEKRSAALGLLKNFVSLAHGPVERRPGLEYITQLRDSTEKGRLLPFEFSVDQAYIIVANDGFFRFYKDGGEIQAGGGGTYEVAHTYGEADLDDIDTAQSADTLYIAQPDHAQATLSRYDHNNWTLADIVYEDGPLASQNITTTTLTPSATTGSITITASAITGINSDTGFQSTDVGRLIGILHGSTWGIAKITAVTSTTVVSATVLTNFGGTSAQSAWKLGFWSDTTGFPRTVTFAFDRLGWAGSEAFPNYNWLSKVSEYTTHILDDPLTDASALNLPLSAGKLNAIRWMRFPRRLTVGTGGTEWWMTDVSGAGPVTAESKQAVPASGHGCSGVKPVEMGNILVFLQKHDKVVRELFYEYENDSFAGEELTVLAEHLTREYGIVRMAFQRTPHRILWCVRSDGKLLGCTYYREHKVTGWHLHETEGWFEDVAVIPGDTRDEVWFIIKRYINGSFVRNIERLAAPFVGDTSTDATLLDSFLSLDNRQDIVSINTSTDVVTVTAHGYSNGDSIRFRTIDSTDSALAGDEGSLNLQEFIISDQTADTFKCKDVDGNYVDFSEYTIIDSNNISTVAKNVTSITALSHLEGESVDVVADGVALDQHTVSAGGITLTDSASVVHVGLHYDSDLWTLTPDIELPRGSSLSSYKRVVSATIQLYKTLGMKIGVNADTLKDQQFSDDDVPAGQPADLFTGEWEVSLKDRDNTDARIFIRQSQPLPMTILAIESEIEIDEA